MTPGDDGVSLIGGVKSARKKSKKKVFAPRKKPGSSTNINALTGNPKSKSSGIAASSLNNEEYLTNLSNTKHVEKSIEQKPDPQFKTVFGNNASNVSKANSENIDTTDSNNGNQKPLPNNALDAFEATFKEIPSSQVESPTISPTKLSASEISNAPVAKASTVTPTSSRRIDAQNHEKSTQQNLVSISPTSKQSTTTPRKKRSRKSSRSISAPQSQSIVNKKKNTTTSVNSSGNTSNKEIVPHQYTAPRNPWTLDPSLNIPLPKENEKSLRDYCSKYRVKRTPEQLRQMALERQERKEQRQLEDQQREKDFNDRIKRQKKEQIKDGDDENRSQASDEKLTSGPQVEIVNGEIRIREESLVVDKRKTADQIDAEMNNVVVEDSTTLTATYTSFTKWNKKTEWTVENTKLFYRALRECGTDFDTMQTYFGGKMSRKQLKKKYLRECRINEKLIDLVMNPMAQIPLDLNRFGIDGKEVDAVKENIQAMPKPGESLYKPNSDDENTPKEAFNENENEKTDSTATGPSSPEKPMTLEEQWGFEKDKETQGADDDSTNIEKNKESEENPFMSLLPGGSTKSRTKRPKFKAKMTKNKKVSKGKGRSVK